jgi:beta-lactamase regulating signal transducer with metallopeptidase domain/Tol biopolymer transport system component
MEGIMAYTQSFFGWLLQTTLIASLVICLILLIQKVLGGKLGPRWSHALWLILLIRMVLPWSPSSRVSLSNLIPSWQRQTQSLQLPDIIERQNVSVSGQTVETSEAITSREAESSLANMEQSASKPATPFNVETRSGPRLVSVRRILAIVWLAGAILIGIYLLVSDLTLWRIVKRDRPLVNQSILELFEECKTQMGIQSLVVVVPSEQVRSLGLFGFVRPRLLLPKKMLDDAKPEELRYVFLHELAHLKRHDIYIGWLTSLLQVMHWFNPLVWFAFYRMRNDRELACDALVLTQTGQDKSQEYGGAIVDLLHRFSRPRHLPAMAGIMENKALLKRRIAMITKFKNKSYRFSLLAIVLIVILACICLPDSTRGKTSANPPVQAKRSVTMRMVRKDGTGYVSMSPDGKYLCDVKGENIVIQELTTGEQRSILTTKGIQDRGEPAYPLMSPDDEIVAYVVFGGGGELRLIGTDGSGQRVLCSGIVRPIRWFPDGSRLLVGIQPRDKEEIEIVSVSIADSTIQTVKTLSGDPFRTSIALSPDARYIAYELPSKDDPKKRDISVIEINSKLETPLVVHPADDRLLGWAPGGRYILLASDRMGSWDAWLLPVVNGKTQGAPKLVARNIGVVTPKGFTQNGSCYYEIAYNAGNVYTATIDLTTGQLLSEPAPLEAPGINRCADWSPDGKSLAYCSYLDPSFQPQVIRIRSLATGQEQELLHKLKLSHVRCLRWSPDGRSLLASWLWTDHDSDPNLRRCVFRIDIGSGDSTTLLQSQKNSVWQAELSPDQKTVYYSAASTIIRRELDSKQEKNVFEFPQNAGAWRTWTLSPNGESIAAGFDERMEKQDGRVRKVIITSSDGGQGNELLRLDKPTGEFSAIAWSRDGRSVLFTVQRAFDIIELWQVNMDARQPRKIAEKNLGWCYSLRVHPDGQRIVFTGAHRFHELWVMENILPKELSK